MSEYCIEKCTYYGNYCDGDSPNCDHRRNNNTGTNAPIIEKKAIIITCNKCKIPHLIEFPKRLVFDGGEISCQCGKKIIFIENLRNDEMD